MTVALKLIAGVLALQLLFEQAFSTEIDNEFDNVVRRSLAVGRAGSMRPGKRTIAVGRFSMRPGKRSLALGRYNLRPGKRAAGEFESCNPEDISEASSTIEFLLSALEEYSAYLKVCVPNAF